LLTSSACISNALGVLANELYPIYPGAGADAIGAVEPGAGEGGNIFGMGGG